MNLILGLDLGKKTGIAKAYEELRVATPYKTVFCFKDLIFEIADLKPSSLVIGWPLLISGEEGLQCKRVKSYVGNILNKTYLMPVHYQDERYTTYEATFFKDEDACSAALILQRFLDKDL